MVTVKAGGRRIKVVVKGFCFVLSWSGSLLSSAKDKKAPRSLSFPSHYRLCGCLSLQKRLEKEAPSKGRGLGVIVPPAQKWASVGKVSDCHTVGMLPGPLPYSSVFILILASGRFGEEQ